MAFNPRQTPPEVVQDIRKNSPEYGVLMGGRYWRTGSEKKAQVLLGLLVMGLAVAVDDGTLYVAREEDRKLLEEME